MEKEKNVIRVKPNEKGEIFIKLYGTKYQIIVENPKKKKDDVDGKSE